MKRSIARQWASALESGEYKQGIGRLRKGGKFCCLGVLCNLHAQEHPAYAKKQKQANKYGGQEYTPPYEVWGHWAGMQNDSGNAPGVGELVEMNDTGIHDFKSIAKFIRKHYKEL